MLANRPFVHALFGEKKINVASSSKSSAQYFRTILTGHSELEMLVS